jgi:hypothetical protein
MSFVTPCISARMNAKGESVWAYDPRPPSYVPSLSSSHLCPMESLFSLRNRVERQEAATLVQSLWRGSKTRKDLAIKNAEEVRRYTPIWRSYDEQYRMNVFCQTLMVKLKKDDPSWDATKTPYYTWMMEQGPVLEEWETFLFQRGWVRPKNTHLNTTVFKRLIQDVLESSGVPQSHWNTTMALYDTFMKTR